MCNLSRYISRDMKIVAASLFIVTVVVIFIIYILILNFVPFDSVMDDLVMEYS